MIRAGVDDPPMARVVGIQVSQLFTLFCLGAGLAAFAGVMGAPILSVYPGLDADMLPLALVVVILGGTGSLLGAFARQLRRSAFSTISARRMFPDLAYVILFLPMVLVLVLRPQGLFGRAGADDRDRRSAPCRPRCLGRAAHRCRSGCGNLLRQHRQPDPVLGDLRARAQRAGRLCAASSRSAMPGCSASPATRSACCWRPVTATRRRSLARDRR